eukprot:239943_1
MFSRSIMKCLDSGTIILLLLVVLWCGIKGQAYCTDTIGNIIGWSPTKCCNAPIYGYSEIKDMGEIQCGERTPFQFIDWSGLSIAHSYTFNTNGLLWNNGIIKFTVDACITNKDSHLYLFSSDTCNALADHDGWGSTDRALCEENGNIFDTNNPYSGGSIIHFQSVNALNAPLDIVIGEYGAIASWDTIAYEIYLQCDIYSVPSISADSCTEREQLGSTFSIEMGQSYKIGNGVFENEILNNNKLLYKIKNDHGHRVILSTVYENPISSTTQHLIIEFGITSNLPQIVTIKDGITGNILGGNDINEYFTTATGINTPFENMWTKIVFETTMIAVYMSGNDEPDSPKTWYLIYEMLLLKPITINYIAIEANETRIDEISLNHDCSNSYIFDIQEADQCHLKTQQLGIGTKSLLYRGESYDYTSIFPYDFCNAFEEHYIMYKITALDGHTVKLSKGDGYLTSYWYIRFLPDDSTKIVTLTDGLDLSKKLGSSVELGVDVNFDNVWVRIEWDYYGYLKIYVSFDGDAPINWIEISRTNYFLIEHSDTIKINSVVIESPTDG